MEPSRAGTFAIVARYEVPGECEKDGAVPGRDVAIVARYEVPGE